MRTCVRARALPYARKRFDTVPVQSAIPSVSSNTPPPLSFPRLFFPRAAFDDLVDGRGAPKTWMPLDQGIEEKMRS